MPPCQRVLLPRGKCYKLLAKEGRILVTVQHKEYSLAWLKRTSKAGSFDWWWGIDEDALLQKGSLPQDKDGRAHGEDMFQIVVRWMRGLFGFS